MKKKQIVQTIFAVVFAATLVLAIAIGSQAHSREKDWQELPKTVLLDRLSEPLLLTHELEEQPSDRSSYEEFLNPPDVVRLSWMSMPNAASLAKSSAAEAVLRAENLTNEPMSVEIDFTADDGGQHSKTLNFGSVRLEARATQTIAISFRDFGLDLSNMKYSGQLHATARASISGESSYHPTTSPFIYFHPSVTSKDKSLKVYGEKTLLKKYRNGDFKKRLSPQVIEPEGAVTSRVIDGGAGSVTDAVRTQSIAQAGNYTTCIRFQIQTVDSSLGIPNGANIGGTEDHYTNANAGIDVIARGVRVQVSRGSWSQTFNANPETGCFVWSHSATSGFSMRVYGYATDSAGNFVRIHTAPNDFSNYPGQTYSILLTNITPTRGGVNTYNVGSFDQKWTTMAALAFGLYRYHDGLSNKAFHVGLDNTTCGSSSAHYGQSNAFITSGRHYIKLGNCPPAEGTAQTRRKFVVTHELGHAIAALYYGAATSATNGGEPAVSFSHNVNPNACGTGDTTYSMRSKEWNSVGFREGFAHFIAAKIWNDQNPEGAFRWFENQTYDLERYAFGTGTNAGGRLENECCVGNSCTTSWSDAGTNEDWMRFFWDWYTNVNNQCPARPTKLDMLKLYRQVRLNGGLTNRNYFEKMRIAANQLTNLPACLKTSRFDAYADENGIQHP